MKPIIAKMGEMKKAMPFIQDIKSRLFTDKVDPEIVFNRKLLFNEVDTLREVLPTIKKVTGAKEVAIVKLEDGGKAGAYVNADGSEEKVENLSNVAEASVPGQPSFSFENVPSVVDVVVQ
jgi:leucyl-tRNA synthetase